MPWNTFVFDGRFLGIRAYIRLKCFSRLKCERSRPVRGEKRMKRALIVYGGWEGHVPDQIADILGHVLKQENYEVELSDTLESFRDEEKMAATDLIVPIWTMGTIERELLVSLLRTIENGTGIAGCHGGMGDAFRNEVEYQFMVGGQWVAHPGNDGVKYRVHIKEKDHPLVRGIEDFDVVTEQYYMHVDPAVNVLATTRFPVAEGPHSPNGPVDMPVIWTKYWGKGKVYYCSLGHSADIIRMPQVLELMRRGMLWATRS